MDDESAVDLAHHIVHFQHLVENLNEDSPG